MRRREEDMKWKIGSPTYRKIENERMIGQDDGKSHILVRQSVREKQEGGDEKEKRLEA